MSDAGFNTHEPIPIAAGGTGTSSAIETLPMIIRSSGCWASTTNGASGITQVELGTNDVDLQVFDFDDSTEEYIQTNIVMPDNYDGSVLKNARFYWLSATATSGDVIWGIQARAFDDDDALDQAWGTAVTVTDTAKGTTNDLAISAAASDMTIGGSPAGGQYVQFRIYRDADAAGDTMTGDARLLAVHLEYDTDSRNA